MPDYLDPELWSQLQGYGSGFVRATPRIITALIFILLTWALSFVAASIMSRVGRSMRMRQSLVEVLMMLSQVAVWVIGVLIALVIVFPSITPAKALTAFGLGSVAIGFAFKDIFENFFAGLLILLREPFKRGDHIRCEEVEGQVERISIRDTHLRQTDGQLMVVPNAQLFMNPVLVRTDQEVRRTSIICGVAYGEDVDAARKVIHDAVVALDSVRDDIRDVQVFAQAFGASSIDFEVAWWTGSRPIDIRASRDQVVGAIKRALDDAGIEIPFPYRTMTFKEPLTIAMQAAEGEDKDEESADT